MSLDFSAFHLATTVEEFFLNAVLTGLGRMFDLITTYYVTRQMVLETNRRVQKAGWRGAILLQIPAIVVGAFNTYIAFFILMWSVFVATSNLEGSYYVRDKGEDAYFKELRELVNRTPWRKLVLGEINLLGSMVIAGILLLVFLGLQDGLGIFMVALALIVHGILKTVKAIQYLKRLRVSSEKEIDNKTPPSEEGKQS
jgi:hypothetical protein